MNKMIILFDYLFVFERALFYYYSILRFYILNNFFFSKMNFEDIRLSIIYRKIDLIFE